LSHEAHEGSRWSQRFLRSRQRLHALTLRNEEAAEAVGALGEVGFAESRSASWEDSSKERLMPLIRAHGRAPRDRASVGLGRLVVVGGAHCSAHSRWPGPASSVPRTTLEMETSVDGRAARMQTAPKMKRERPFVASLAISEKASKRAASSTPSSAAKRVADKRDSLPALGASVGLHVTSSLVGVRLHETTLLRRQVCEFVAQPHKCIHALPSSRSTRVASAGYLRIFCWALV
jgi:hypothetical protein